MVEAIKRFVPMLRNQGENEAAECLSRSAASLESYPLDSKRFAQTVGEILDSFEGEHELIAYTLKESNPHEWSEADELAVASNRVLALARRLK